MLTNGKIDEMLDIVDEMLDIVKEQRKRMATIRCGDKVTILIPNGCGRNGVEYKEKTGRAIMLGPAGWVLNMGGRYGTPAVATEMNFVRVRKGQR